MAAIWGRLAAAIRYRSSRGQFLDWGQLVCCESWSGLVMVSISWPLISASLENTCHLTLCETKSPNASAPWSKRRRSGNTSAFWRERPTFRAQASTERRYLSFNKSSRGQRVTIEEVPKGAVTDRARRTDRAT